MLCMRTGTFCRVNQRRKAKGTRREGCTYQYCYYRSCDRSFTIIVALIIKTSGGGLDAIWQSTKSVVERMHYNFTTLFAGNLQAVISQCSSSPMEQLSADAKVIWSAISNNGSNNIRVISTVLPDIARANLQKCYFNSVVPIGSRISTHAGMFGMVASGLIADVYSSIGNLSETIKGLIETVMNHFN